MLILSRAHATNLKVEGPHCILNSVDFESTRGATMVSAEGLEKFWNFDSSRLAKSALLFFNFREGLFPITTITI